MLKTLFVISLSIALASTGMGAVYQSGSPASTNNDDSCDISNQPAATLLLPYFEVDYATPQTSAQTTLMTITNTNRLPEIARVTVWTDWGYPVLYFNIFLTGYDVQALNLYDILARGVIAPTSGTSNTTTPGNRSADNGDNPNFLASAATACAQLPGNIPPSIVSDLRTALTTGTSLLCAGSKVGSTHTNAVGYITVDVVATCGVTAPDDPAYYSTELLYDNVLIGDYEQINPNPTTGNYAGGNPLVHIRAVPEGGKAGQVVTTNLPYTFYDRFTPRDGARTIDRRQPLPSTFASRFVEGGTSGFNTSLKIWREGVTGERAACSTYVNNSATHIADIVRFDEHENANTLGSDIVIDPIPDFRPTLPLSSAPSTSNGNFPPLSTASGDVAGWLYIAADNGGSLQYSVTSPNGAPRNYANSSTVGQRQSQNWIVTSMSAEGRYSVDFDAASLGNGCSPAPASTALDGAIIGPAANINP